MVYAVVKGYELAHREAEHPPRAATRSKHPLGDSETKVEWVP
jgi:hypothetical protein